MNRQYKQGSSGPSHNHFSLKSVCWGYRDIFARIIDRLHSEKLLGAEHSEVTRQFYRTLERAEEDFFDHVLHEFLKALNPDTQWIMSLPGIFSDVTEMGCRFAEAKLYYGTAFFRILGEGGFGRNPDQIRHLMTFLRQIWKVDVELAFAFLKGYHLLIERLMASEIEKYISTGVEIFHRSRQSGVRFMEGTLKTSENTIAALTRECRLQDVKDGLSRLLKALVGWEVEVADLGHLDSDYLIERGSRVVCLYRRLYLPHRVRHFAHKNANRAWYMLAAVVAAGMLAEQSFCRIHGHPDFKTCEDLVGSEPLRLNLFQIIEYIRVLQRIKQRWIGIARLVDDALAAEYRELPPRGAEQRLFYEIMGVGRENRLSAAGRIVRDMARRSTNVFHTADLVREVRIDKFKAMCPEIGAADLPPFSFLPDFLFPGEVSRPPSDRAIADLKDKAKRRQRDNRDNQDPQAVPDPEATPNEHKGDEQDETQDGVVARFVYDEWSHTDNDYFRNHCLLREIREPTQRAQELPRELTAQVNRTRKIFERLKPIIVKKEKYLADGDLINSDLLLEFLTLKHREPSPKINFYEKPSVNTRDLCVLILIDVSGSTGNEIEDHQILDIEKHSSLILGQGLDSLGDRFSLCGFSGQGRENCEFYVFKDFDEKWGADIIGRVLAARPRTSTRIGAALRHAGYRLVNIDAKQRLIILITDGKPMDSGYDASNRYAQYDVRMACEENRRNGIHTFGISTEENTRADMEIMFPGMHFAILPDIRDLPRILPRLYIRLTV